MTVTKKIGRPKKDNTKEIQTRIRMTKEQNEKLLKCSQVLKITKTDVLMNGLDIVYNDLPKKE